MILKQISVLSRLGIFVGLVNHGEICEIHTTLSRAIYVHISSLELEVLISD